MNSTLSRAVRGGLALLPARLVGGLVAREPRLVPYLNDRDFKVRLNSCYFGVVTFWLSPKYRIERILLYEHAYDEKTLLYLMRVVFPGDICIDVGANIGSIALSLAHRAGERGRVYAIEPGPLLNQRLSRNVEASALSNVDILRAAVGATNGTMFWKLEEGENRGNAFVSEDETATPCDVYTLDTLVINQSIERIDFIKIDVEGMELAVIQGALEIIRLHHPILLIETRSDAGPLAPDVTSMLALLSNEGYDFWDIDVARAQLRSCEPRFNFIPCDPDAMPQNTLCVHASRKSRLFDSPGAGQDPTEHKFSTRIC